MPPGEFFDVIGLREAVSSGRFEWRQHVLRRLSERRIKQAVVLESFGSTTLVEAYLMDVPYPSALLLTWHEEKPLHVVASHDRDHQWAYIITVYEPDLEHFGPDYMTRRDVP